MADSNDIFAKVCEELFIPDTSGYEFFVESHDVTIYRQYNEESGLYTYKVYGYIRDVPPEICASVYMDIEYRKCWDSYAYELREIKDGETEGIYWQVKFPFMMSNRDYCYQRQYKELNHNGEKIWCVFAEGMPFAGEEERSGVIRVTDYLQKMVLKSDGKGGTQAYMHYYDNPKGMIPAWLINWGAKTGVPAFLTDMEKACKGYPAYLEKRQSS